MVMVGWHNGVHRVLLRHQCDGPCCNWTRSCPNECVGEGCR